MTSPTLISPWEFVGCTMILTHTLILWCPELPTLSKKELYKLGARTIGVLGVPPIGCLPAQRTLAGGFPRECAAGYNQAAQLANTKLSAKIASLSKNLIQSKLALNDIYNPLIDLIVNPQKHGFEVVDKGCCGTGNIEVVILCNKYSGTCEDNTNYLFWDSYHPTQRGYMILVDQIIKKYIDILTTLT